MKVSVVIPTRNRAHILPHCLKKLLMQTRPPDEIILVDDASTDETQKIIAKCKMQNAKLRYIRFDERMGHWHARNVAVKEASGQLILFVDSDVLVNKNFIKDHLEIHKKDNKVVVQGLVRHIRNHRSFGNFTLRVDGLCLTGLVIQNCSLKKKWLLDAGLFDEHKLMGYMDVEFGMRLKKMGIKKVYAFKKCIAYHVDGYPTRKWLLNLLKKFQERGITSHKFIERAESWTGERIANKKTLFLSKILFTQGWADKENAIDFSLGWIDSPFVFMFPLLKEILKTHYRSKGILHHPITN